MKQIIIKIILSLIIIFLLSAQLFKTARICFALPELVPAHLCYARTWPFLMYRMYRFAHYEDEKIDHFLVAAVVDNSSEKFISEDDLEIGFWRYLYDFVPAVRENKKEKLEMYQSLIENEIDQQVGALRLYSEPWILKKDGVIKGKSELIREVELGQESK